MRTRKIEPESVETAFGRIAGCRDKRTRFGVFIPNDRETKEVVVWSIYLRNGDVGRYRSYEGVFKNVAEDYPHLCVGLYDRELRHQSLSEFAMDVQTTRETRDDFVELAYFSGDYKQMTGKEVYFARRKDGGF